VTPLADEEIKRILVVMAHPDDCDFGAGGTIALWTKKGIEVSYCIVTNGDQGGEASEFSLEDMAKVRQREQREAGKVLGVSQVTYLNYRDGSLVPTLELPDHLAAGEAAIQAVYPDARNPYAFTDLKESGFEPWRVRELWITGSPQPNHFVDITETFSKKMDALKAHVSQTAHNPELEPMVRSWGEKNGEANGLAAGRIAEVFKVVNTD
jgi:LmbE family N-acetylglucosaminyl deacetylase